ncbi:PIN domain-containing protein [Candidatus Gottesmanbacteria bacterium]|nr:PIN domain-containing protein [Candidatus Gottesmanbacteria bacterium]
MIFIDTNAFIALIDPKDKFHKAAIGWWKANRETKLITSNIVTIETLGWMRYKKGKRIAVEAGKTILFGEGISILPITNQDELAAWQLFQKIDGRGISMVDCTSFVLMKRLNIKKVFTFDQDFKTVGFSVLPAP